MHGIKRQSSVLDGQKAALGLDLSAAIDPKRTLADQ